MRLPPLCFSPVVSCLKGERSQIHSLPILFTTTSTHLAASKMLVQIRWFLSLLSIVVSSSTYSPYNTSISSTIISSATPINSTHQTSTTSSTSSTTGPSPTPSTFYLIANETATEFVGSYVILIPDHEPFIPLSRDKALRFNTKTPPEPQTSL